MPLRSEAPAGRSIVSTTDVVKIRTGSPMSDFLMNILRVRPALMLAFASRRLGVLAALGNAGATGVDEADNGGVGLAKGGTGVPRPELKIPGLIWPSPGESPGDGPGEGRPGTFRAGDNGPPFGGNPGEARGDGTPNG